MLKNMSLKRSFFLIAFLCLLIAVALAAAVWLFINKLCADYYPGGGLMIDMNGGLSWNEVSAEQQRIHDILLKVQLCACVVLPVLGLAAAGLLFYRCKLKTPIALLLAGTKRIQNKDLDFVLKYESRDELGQLCRAFELMRGELLQTNLELWQRAEDRKRLNAAFAHDLRNPVTALKGAVSLLETEEGGKPALRRLKRQIARIEQYVEVMGRVQRLEDVQVCRRTVNGETLRQDLQETVQALASGRQVKIRVENLPPQLNLDGSLFAVVAENLLNNAVRFAKERISVSLFVASGRLELVVADDGVGYPEKLLAAGPRPFGRGVDAPEHFGMGLYICSLICAKHGGGLDLHNNADGGAVAAASFRIN